MKRPQGHPAEDADGFQARQTLQRKAQGKVTGPFRRDEETGIDLEPNGVWVPMKIFVSWREAGVDGEKFRDQWASL